jgi:hypothetical protein
MRCNCTIRRELPANPRLLLRERLPLPSIEAA